MCLRMSVHMCMLKHPTTSFISVFFRTLADVPLAPFALKRCRQAFDVKLWCNFSSSPNILTRTFLAFAEKFCSFFVVFFPLVTTGVVVRERKRWWIWCWEQSNIGMGWIYHPTLKESNQRPCAPDDFNKGKETSWIHLMRTNKSL